MPDLRKTAYDLAQKVGQNMDQLENCKGWSEVIVPELEERAKEAQATINNIHTSVRVGDHARGVLQTCTEILILVEQKKANSKMLMANNLTIN